MSKEIYISTTPHETRLAIVEDEQLAEIYYERENEYTLAGSIYNGKVTRVLPGMQSAFVDIGLERDAFLYVTDFMEEAGDSADFESTGSAGAGGRREGGRGGRDRGRGRRDESRSEAPPETRTAQQGSGAELADLMDEPVAPRPTEDAGQGGSEEGQGSRRWRGRRGRRRGGRREEGEAQVSGAQASESTEEPGFDEPVGTEFDAAAEESSAIEIDLGAEPAAPQGYAERGRRFERGGRDRGGRGGQDRDRRGGRDRGGDRDRGSRSGGGYSYGAEDETPDYTGEPTVLPGEKIRKYRDAAEVAAEDAVAAASAPKIEVLSATAPSFEVVGWDGVSAVLPGESFSRQRNRDRNTDRDRGGRRQFETAPKTVMSEPQADTTDSQDAAPALELDSDVEGISKSTTASAAEAEAQASSEVAVEMTDESADFEPEEGASASVSTPSRSDLRRVEKSKAAKAEPAASEEPQVGLEESSAAQEETPEPAAAEYVAEENGEPDPTTYDLKSAAPAQAMPEAHNFTAVQASGEMFSADSEQDADPIVAIPSQDLPSPASPIAQEGAVRSEGETGAEASADSPVEFEFEEEDADEIGTDIPEVHAFGDGDLEEEEIDGDEFELDQALGLGEYDADEYDEESIEADLNEEIETVSDELETEEESDFAERSAARSDEFTVEDFGGEPDEEESSEETAPRTQPAGRRERHGRRDRRGGRSSGGDHGRGRGRQSMQTTDMPAINELLKPGQEILVQIAKEPIAKKGARITSHIALPGRFLVFMPTVNHTGVSRKISSDEERRRLKTILLSEKGDAQGGFIVRTAAEHASEEELRNDLRFLIHLWNDIKARSESSKSPALIYHDLNLVERILRDQVTDNFSAIWVDSEQEYERVLRFLQRFQPSLVRRVKLYTKETSLFEHFGVTQEIDKALKSKVWLKSGGSIVINQTEALVAIDINTGKYVGKTARLEDTILKTNLDAIPEIVRQIRLRDLGGIIVIDFIDMDERKNRAKVMQALEDALKTDRAPSKVLPFNDFGLVIMTRKRVKQSLERTLCIPDPVTEGTGMIKSPVTIANEIYVEMRKLHRHLEKQDILLRVHPEVVKQLKSNGGRRLQELEDMTRKTILVKSDPALSPEQFDIH